MGQIINIPKYLPLLKDYPINKLASIKVGGPARFFYKPMGLKELSCAIEFANENSLAIKFLGNATNVVFSDGGFNGLVVCLNGLKGVKIDGNNITFTAGESLSNVYKTALKLSLTGAEHFSKIPASVGGAITMNAGAFGHNISELVSYVEVIENGYIKPYDFASCKFKYRSSVFKRKNLPIIKAKLHFKKGQKSQIIATEKELSARRKTFQPKGYSCGSVFKNPLPFKAGKLIEDSGLKGFSLGGAKVSEMHANFIINTGFATAKDVFDLKEIIKNRVFQNFGVMLKEEIEFIGEF